MLELSRNLNKTGYIDDENELKFIPFLNVTDDVYDPNERPTYKLTNFRLYDQKNHPCSIDDVDEKNLVVFVNGSVKIITDDDPKLENSVEIRNVRIKSAWIFGFDLNETVRVGLSTSKDVDLFLLEPEDNYKTFFNEYYVKAVAAKTIVGILLNDPYLTYDEVIHNLNISDDINGIAFSERFVVENADFIINHIFSFDQGRADDEDLQLMNTDFVKTFIEWFQIQIEDFNDRELVRKKFQSRQNVNVKAFVTPIVRAIFEKSKSFRRKIAKPIVVDDDVEILIPDIEKRVENKSIDSERLNVSHVFDNDRFLDHFLIVVHPKNYWSIDETSLAFEENGVKSFTKLNSTNNCALTSGDFVSFYVREKSSEIFPLYARVNYFELKSDSPDNIFAHVSFLIPSRDTILGCLADDQEYFFVGRCENVAVHHVVRNEEIQYFPITTNWKNMGGIDDSHNFPKCPFVRQWYDSNKPAFYYRKIFVGGSDTIARCPDCAKNEPKIDSDFFLPLQTFDVFGGCGGLSEGLRQSDVADVRWAVEIDHDAAESFRKNHKSATVFEMNANDLLKAATSRCSDVDGQRVPTPGEVDLIVGGPPCQGFSQLNRFRLSENSQFKNSCIMPFYGFVEFYRPRFVVMESVTAFAQWNENEVLKLVFRTLTRIGYQCTFGVLQAGSYGVPQTRRRFFVLAAAPNDILPNLPSPTHEFPKTNLSVTVGIKYFSSDVSTSRKRLLPSVTVGETLRGLPPIEPGNFEKIRNSYADAAEPGSFDEKMRNGGTIVVDHVCRSITPLNLERINRIPKFPFGCDWRNLLDIKTSDGKNYIIYEYTDEYYKIQLSSCFLQTDCSCKNASLREATRKHKNLVPYYLLHGLRCKKDANAGTFGRVNPKSFFDTLTTSADPSAKQGRVLHPEEDRTLSVREYARAQGFCDTYIFNGESISSKYRQIGNAVPPPLAKAIGKEILNAVVRRYE